MNMFELFKYMNGSFFSKFEYMNGVGFQILAYKSLPKSPVDLCGSFSDLLTHCVIVQSRQNLS